jgi:hypothetical protein
VFPFLLAKFSCYACIKKLVGHQLASNWTSKCKEYDSAKTTAELFFTAVTRHTSTRTSNNQPRDEHMTISNLLFQLVSVTLWWIYQRRNFNPRVNSTRWMIMNKRIQAIKEKTIDFRHIQVAAKYSKVSPVYS